MGYKVTAPLVIIANDDLKSGDWYGYADAFVPEGWNDDRCKQLVREGMLETVSASEATTDGGKTSGTSDTVDDILAEVSDDKGKAQAALDVENAKEKPRKTLVDKLQSIVEG